MISDKKMTIIRLVLFVVIAYVPMFFFVRLWGENLQVSGLISTLEMFPPAIAHLLTRLITREGFSDMKLRVNLKGHGKHYLMAVLLPTVTALLSCFITIVVFIPGYDISKAINGENWMTHLAGYLLLSASGIILFLVCFGEEFGWRAYLTPKLETLMPEPLALIVSGIIWAMWHAPMIVIGLNFGTDYPFFPWLGFLCMSIFCILWGAVLTWLTKKTDSIYPAALCHALIDTIVGVVMGIFIYDDGQLEKLNGVESFCVLQAGVFVLGIIFFALVCQDERKKKEG